MAAVEGLWTSLDICREVHGFSFIGICSHCLLGLAAMKGMKKAAQSGRLLFAVYFRLFQTSAKKYRTFVWYQ
jgi:hypothetical protein